MVHPRVSGQVADGHGDDDNIHQANHQRGHNGRGGRDRHDRHGGRDRHDRRPHHPRGGGYDFNDFVRDMAEARRATRAFRGTVDDFDRMLRVDPRRRDAASAHYQALQQRNLRWRDLDAMRRGQMLDDIENGLLPSPHYGAGPLQPRGGYGYVPVPVPVPTAPAQPVSQDVVIYMASTGFVHGEFRIGANDETIFQGQNGVAYDFGMMDISQVQRGQYYMLGRMPNGLLAIYPADANGHPRGNNPVAVQRGRTLSLNDEGGLPSVALAESGVVLGSMEADYFAGLSGQAIQLSVQLQPGNTADAARSMG